MSVRDEAPPPLDRFASTDAAALAYELRAPTNEELMAELKRYARRTAEDMERTALRMKMDAGR